MDKVQWLKKNTFHHRRFVNKKRLVRLKERKNLHISLAFPTLNEEKTIGKEIRIAKRELIQKYPLLDEIAVIDSGSTDRTREVAANAGADVYLASNYLRKYGVYHGKGDNLWKSLYLLSGDIIIWVDGDIRNFHSKFIYGLLGPLLEDDKIKFVKSFYERPLHINGAVHPSGGGRVTEILVRPMFAAFWPDLAGFLQPLSGEYAGRREILETVPFRTGFGVETGLLIDIYKKYGLKSIAQVDMDRRLHHNKGLAELGEMSFAILHTLLSRMKKYKMISLPKKYFDKFLFVESRRNKFFIGKHKPILAERPPMARIIEYRKKRD